jgi:hypothetical protein
MSICFDRRGVFVLALGLLAVAGGNAGAQSACRPQNWLSTFMKEELTRYMTATGGDNAAVRDSLHLPTAAANDVQLVTSDSVCAVASAAYSLDRQGIGAGLSGQVHVVKVDTIYVVLDPDFDNQPVAGRPKASVTIVFNSSWQPLARY